MRPPCSGEAVWRGLGGKGAVRSGAKRAGLSGECGYSRPCRWFCFPGAEREAGRLGEEGRRGVGRRAGPANQDAASARAALPAVSGIPDAFSSGSYTLGGVYSLKKRFSRSARLFRAIEVWRLPLYGYYACIYFYILSTSTQCPHGARPSLRCRDRLQ